MPSKTKKPCTGATVQDNKTESNQIQDNYSTDEVKTQSKYEFADVDEEFSMIEYGIDAVNCIQIALTEGYPSSGMCEMGLYYLTTHLRKDIEQLHGRVLDNMRQGGQTARLLSKTCKTGVRL